MDAGTENINVIDMQKALSWYHGDTCSGEKSAIVGSSHANQVIQAELDRSRKEWNEHRVRVQSGIMPAGKPDLLYHHPELYDARGHKFPVNMADVETLKQMCAYPPECLEDARIVFTEIVNRKHLRYPDTIEEAIQFLRALKRP